MRALERSLYGAGAAAGWDGAALWRALGNGLHGRRAQAAARAGDGLAALYP